MVDDPFLDSEFIEQFEGCRKVTRLEEHLASCDIVCIHIPLTPETKHRFSSDFFRKAKPNLILINLARGGIVDEQALLEFLDSNPEAGAHIDVWEGEPHVTPMIQELLQLPNFVWTPHIGGLTHEAVERMHQFDISKL